MTLSSKRAEYLSIACLALTLLLFAAIFILGRWSGFFAVSALAFLVLSSSLIWLVLLIQFHQRSLAEQEKLDMTQLDKEQQGRTIFTEQANKTELFAVAQRRLGILEKWFIPAFGALIALYQIGIGIFLLYGLKAVVGFDIETRQPLLCSVFLIAIAFATFLMSRYATGLSTEPMYKPLRAGGSSLLGVAVFCFAVAICLALVQFKFPIPIKVIVIILPSLLIALGIETALNVVLDIYRPRIKGQYARASFDSRLLGVINEPGEILHTVAGAIDYQFGFKVSQTWFYQLLERAIVPLILFGAVCLYLLSCIVVVNPNEQAIIERFGNPVSKNGEVRQLEPGLAFKYPWPIDIAYKYPTKQIKEIYIGYEPKIDPKTNLPQRERQLLWGKEHYEAEHSVLVASQQTGENISAGAVPVSLIKANVPVQYRIRDLYSYLYKHYDDGENNEPEKLLMAICYRELARFAASAKIEVDTPQQMEQSILGAGRSYAKKTLTERIQAAADSHGLGVEIIFVGLQGIHPPPDVAADYQKVVSSVQKKYAAVLDAHTRRNSILSNLTGSVSSAEKLYGLALEYQQAQQDNRPDAEKIGQSLDLAFTQASGDIFKTLAEAKSYSFERATLSKANGERFADQLKPYRAAPDIYKRNLRLEVFEQSLEKARKYVVVADQNDTQVFIVDVEEKLTPSLYDITGLEEPTGP